MRNSLDELVVACCHDKCIFRGTMSEYRSHNCPIVAADVTDVDSLVKIAEYDGRIDVKIECFRRIVDELLQDMDVLQDIDKLQDMYDLMKRLRWNNDVQKIGLDAILVLCTADRWKSVVNAVCMDLSEHLERLKDEDCLKSRILSLKSVMPELDACGMLRSGLMRGRLDAPLERRKRDNN